MLTLILPEWAETKLSSQNENHDYDYDKIYTSYTSNIRKFKLKNSDHPLFELIPIKNKSNKIIDIKVNTYNYALFYQFRDKNDNPILNVNIEPRNLINRLNFEIILNDVFDISNVFEEISGGKEAEFLKLYYLIFLNKLKRSVQKGLYKEYIEVEDNLNTIKERLLFSKHFKINISKSNKLKAYCSFSEYSVNNIINHTFYYTILYIKKLLEGDNFKDIVKLCNNIIYSYYNDICFKDTVPVNLSKLKRIKYTRQSERFRIPIKYCMLILKNLGVAIGDDSEKEFSGLYVDMNLLFEQYICKILKKNIYNLNEIIKTEHKNENNIQRLYINNSEKLKDLFNSISGIEYQKREQYLDFNDTFKIIPDIIFYNDNNEVVFIADTKYKKLEEFNTYKIPYNIEPKDRYQIISYAVKYNIKDVMLIYPRPNTNKFTDIPSPFVIGEGDFKVNLHIGQYDLQSEIKSNKSN